jgi:amino acid transporter
MGRATDLGEITRASDLNPRRRTMSRATVVGLFTGLLLGLALVLGSFGDMLIVALFGAIGVVVVKVLEGELDLEDLAARTRRRRAR